jgi:hypothetical protein
VKAGTPQAAERLKAIIVKLDKSLYDVVVRILSEVASATMKKMLGI